MIEQDVRLSRSILWDLQRQFYLENGINFWRERASFTSASTVVVSACVDLLLTYLKERVPHLNSDEPIYLLELGTGSGCFAYRFLKSFVPQKQLIPELANLDVRYVMTDFIPEIVEIWQRNSYLKTFVENRELDFAVFDPSTEQAVMTSCFEWTLDAPAFVNAPIIIANALFDTIGVDGFRCENGVAREITVSVEADPTAPLASLISNTLLLHQKVGEPIRLPYYENQEFDQLLMQYADTLKNGTLSLPIGALEIIDNLRRMTNNSFAMLCCSRGFTDLSYAEKSESLHYEDLSFPLNFDALKKYFANCGGELLTPIEDAITRCLTFGLLLQKEGGTKLTEIELGKTKFENIERENTRVQYLKSSRRQMDVFELVKAQELQLKELLDVSAGTRSVSDSAIAFLSDILKTGKYDPLLFLTCTAHLLDKIESELPSAGKQEIDQLTNAVHLVDSNIYAFERSIPAIKDGEDVYTLLISVWQRANQANHQTTGRSLFVNSDD
jgi:SAM-dependent MidA family methyltransferase